MNAGTVDPKTKRVTIPVTMIHFYVSRANEPKSKWRSMS